jgi:alpha-mannosidase
VTDLEGSPKVSIRTPAEFFAEAEREYPDAPVWSGEMYLEYHRGTYTSQSAMKRGNRRTEHLLREAELWCATAALRVGHPYPYAALDEIWRETLLMQFHDILPGSSIAWVHREARLAYARLADRLDGIITAALAALTGPGSADLTANAAPHERGGVPALAVAPAGTVQAPDVRVESDVDGVVLDNGLLRARIGPDGTVVGLRDLVADREVLRPGTAANVLHLHPDTPNNFDAWDIDEYYRHRRRTLTGVTETTVEPGQVRVTRHDGDSTYAQTVSLAAGERVLRFRTEVDWHERETLLKVAFPIDVQAAVSSSEIQFGHVQRPTHSNTSWDAAKFEICAHRWLHVGEPGYGVALVNDGTYGHDVSRHPPGDTRGAQPTTVRLSLLRSPPYPDPDTDQGRHAFEYALVCGAGIPDAIREGYRANLPVRRHRGGSAVAPLVAVTDPAVVIEAVKLADDRSGDVVVRLYESLGGRARTRLTASFGFSRAEVCDLLERSDDEVARLAPIAVDGHAVDVELGPFQVVTLRLGGAG